MTHAGWITTIWIVAGLNILAISLAGLRGAIRHYELKTAWRDIDALQVLGVPTDGKGEPVSHTPSPPSSHPTELAQ